MMKLDARQQDALARLTAAARELDLAALAMQDALVELRLAGAELGARLEITIGQRAAAPDDYAQHASAAIARAMRP
jgi:hypothetical protein